MNERAISAVGGLPPGTQLGRYQTVKRLALGGMAELYLARHDAEAGFQKLVALKRVLPHLGEDDEFVGMFLNEARLAASLVHPNIAQVSDFGSAGREYFMVMEFVHGRSVGDLLRASAKLGGVPQACALTIASGVAAALHYAHEVRGPEGAPLGLVHRDVSPSNILVSYDGGVKLVDFGIAKATATATATRSRTIKGKLAYMSPEQAQGGAVDRRSDVFSLGIVLYELSTGRRCFYAEGEFALLNKVADARFDRPTKCVPGFAVALETIIMRALEADPANRYPTARAIQRDLEALAVEQGIAMSSALLSDYLGEVFGEQPYPTAPSTMTFPHASSSVTAVSPTFDPTPPRSLWGWPAIGVLGASIGLGIGAAVVWGRATPVSSPTSPTVQNSSAADPVVPRAEDGAKAADAQPVLVPAASAAQVDRPDDQAVDQDVDVDDAEVVIEDPVPEVPVKPGRRVRKRRSKPKEPGKVSPPSEFLPPSHRGG